MGLFSSYKFVGPNHCTFTQRPRFARQNYSIRVSRLTTRHVVYNFGLNIIICLFKLNMILLMTGDVT